MKKYNYTKSDKMLDIAVIVAIVLFIEIMIKLFT